MSQYRNASGDEPGSAPDLIPRNGFSLREVQALADVTHDARDIAPASLPVLSRRWGW